ncbi:MAG: MBL fold metallo-hydrolase [Chloroflexi bacterium]|nr:MBL fold metallo-hydrolase [Chloroflexota bacterium]
MSAQVLKFTVGPYSNNCYVLLCPETNESVLVDLSADPEAILRHVAGTKVQYVVVTHGDRDHIDAYGPVMAQLRVPVAMHAADAQRLPEPPARLLGDGELLTFGRQQMRVLHTPGHTPGSICLLLDQHLIAGDTLFPGGPGRTKTPADLDAVLRSIREKLMPLPDDVAVHPGHGDDTTIGRERPTFEAFLRAPRDPNLCGDVSWG